MSAETIESLRAELMDRDESDAALTSLVLKHKARAERMEAQRDEFADVILVYQAHIAATAAWLDAREAEDRSLVRIDEVRAVLNGGQG